MKQILTFLALLIGFSATAQDTPPPGTKQATTNQTYIAPDSTLWYRVGSTIVTPGYPAIPAFYKKSVDRKELKDSVNITKKYINSVSSGKTDNINPNQSTTLYSTDFSSGVPALNYLNPGNWYATTGGVTSTSYGLSNYLMLNLQYNLAKHKGEVVVNLGANTVFNFFTVAIDNNATSGSLVQIDVPNGLFKVYRKYNSSTATYPSVYISKPYSFISGRDYTLEMERDIFTNRFIIIDNLTSVRDTITDNSYDSTGWMRDGFAFSTESGSHPIVKSIRTSTKYKKGLDIVYLGDSNYEGVNNYPDTTQSIPFKMIAKQNGSAAVSGRSSGNLQGAIRRMSSEIIPLSPRYVDIMIMTNDVNPSIANILAMCNLARRSGITPILNNIPWRSDYSVSPINVKIDSVRRLLRLKGALTDVATSKNYANVVIDTSAYLPEATLVHVNSIGVDRIVNAKLNQAPNFRRYENTSLNNVGAPNLQLTPEAIFIGLKSTLDTTATMINTVDEKDFRLMASLMTDAPTEMGYKFSWRDRLGSQRVEAMEFYKNGNTKFFGTMKILGYLSAANLSSNLNGISVGSTSGQTDLKMSRINVDKWYLRVNATTESGSNAGSDFELIRRDDSGGNLGVGIQQKRSNGNIGFGTNFQSSVKLYALTGSDAQIGFVIRASNVTQSASLMEAQNSAGSTVFAVSPSGQIKSDALTASTMLKTDASKNIVPAVAGTDYLPAVDPNANRIGIGVIPTVGLEIQGTSFAATQMRSVAISNTDNPVLSLRRARTGTSALLLGDAIGGIGWRGYDGTSYGSGDAASIDVHAYSDFTTGDHGTRMSFNVTPKNSTTRINPLILGPQSLNLSYDIPNPTGVQAGFYSNVLGKGDNTTYKGVAAANFVAEDRSDVDATNKGVLLGINVSVIPKVARNNVPADDVNGVMINNSGTAKATDAIYLSHNPSIVGNEWSTIFESAANSNYGIRLMGNTTTQYLNFGNKLTVDNTGKINSDALTASTMLKADASKNIVSAVAGTDYATPASVTAAVDGVAAGIPTIALGLASTVGTGATISIVGNNRDGVITLNTGTSITTGGTLFTVTFGGGFSYPVSCIPILQNNIVYSTFNALVAIGSQNANSWSVANGAIPGQTIAESRTYKWNYHVGGY